MLEMIGKGGSSKVYRVVSQKNHKQYALKKVAINMMDDEAMRSYATEIQMLKVANDLFFLENILKSFVEIKRKRLHRQVDRRWASGQGTGDAIPRHGVGRDGLCKIVGRKAGHAYSLAMDHDLLQAGTCISSCILVYLTIFKTDARCC